MKTATNPDRALSDDEERAKEERRIYMIVTKPEKFLFL